MSSTPRTSEQQFDKDFEQYQVELHACPSPVRQELNESFAARVQAGQGEGTQPLTLEQFEDWCLSSLQVVQMPTIGTHNEDFHSFNRDLAIAQVHGYLQKVLRTIQKMKQEQGA